MLTVLTQEQIVAREMTPESLMYIHRLQEQVALSTIAITNTISEAIIPTTKDWTRQARVELSQAQTEERAITLKRLRNNPELMQAIEDASLDSLLDDMDL